MGYRIVRGPQRTAKPDIFMSHSSRDKAAALNLATTLNLCAIDVWLDDWELEVGQSLTDGIANAMDVSRYIAILITENYNKSVWTKNEYKRALAREQKEGGTVMLPLIVGGGQIPEFLEEKIYIDLRTEYFSGIAKLVGMIHELSQFRVSGALQARSPQSVADVWSLLVSVGFDPYVVLGKDDFDEMLEYGLLLSQGEADETAEEYAIFNPDMLAMLVKSPGISDHIKVLAHSLPLNTRQIWHVRAAAQSMPA